MHRQTREMTFCRGPARRKCIPLGLSLWTTTYWKAKQKYKHQYTLLMLNCWCIRNQCTVFICIVFPSTLEKEKERKIQVTNDYLLTFLFLKTVLWDKFTPLHYQFLFLIQNLLSFVNCFQTSVLKTKTGTAGRCFLILFCFLQVLYSSAQGTNI